MRRDTWPGRRAAVALLVAASAWSPGCGGAGGGGGSGSVQILAEAEETIPEGLEPGTGEENIQDGWAVQYTRFLVTLGNFRASRSSAPGDEVRDDRVWVVDLMNLPAGGLVLSTFEDLAAERWDRFGFDMPRAGAGAEPAAGVSEQDFRTMVQNGWSVWVAGTLSKPGGERCHPETGACEPVGEEGVRFDWGLAAGTAFDDCASDDGDAGFAVPTGGSVPIKPTLHGDHWFFTNITQGAELTERRAQWIADSDLDGDGLTTLEELGQVLASDVFAQPPYNLSGALIPIVTAHDYLEAQARTLGDYQGEGECPTRTVLP